MSTAAAVAGHPIAMPKPPTEAEIMQLLRERMPGLALYNPSEIWLRAQVHGIEHFFPPDLDGAVEPHPVTGEVTICNGIYTVKGRFLTQKDSSGKQIQGQDAQSIVAYLIHRERFGRMGVVWLPGRSDEEDEALKGLGRDRWLEYQEERDDEILARRREFKTNWERNPTRQGVPCPPPTSVENMAVERSQEREVRKEYGFECNVPDCPGYATDDWTKFAKHMAVGHQVRAVRNIKTGVVTLTNPAGDTQTIRSIQATDGKPKALKGDEGADGTAEGLAEARGALETSGQPPQQPVKDDHRRGPKSGKGRGRGKKRG